MCAGDRKEQGGSWSVCLCIISCVPLIRCRSNTNLLTALSTKHSRWDNTHARTHTHTHRHIIYKTSKQESCEPEIRKIHKPLLSPFRCHLNNGGCIYQRPRSILPDDSSMLTCSCRPNSIYPSTQFVNKHINTLFALFGILVFLPVTDSTQCTVLPTVSSFLCASKNARPFISLLTERMLNV